MRSALHAARKTARATLPEASWLLFVPYLAVYLAGMALDLESGTVRGLFMGLHVLSLLVVLGWSGERLTETPRRIPWFWLGLALLFLLPGAYLEFPGDGWTHLSRLNEKQADAPLRLTPWPFKMAYFWGWSLLGGLAPALQRIALTIYGAFWQLLLAHQLYRFARRIGFSQVWAQIQVFGAICVLGNAVFGFFRYYALSSTPLAYIAYLRGAMALLDLAERRPHPRRSVCILLVTLLLMVFNHLQEVLLVLTFGLALVLSRWLETRSVRGRAATVGMIVALFAASFLMADQLVALAEVLGVPRARFVPQHVSSSLGCFRIWDPSLSFWKTTGVHGLLAIALAVAFSRCAPLVATLVLTAPVLLLFPPFSLSLTAVTSPDAAYRLLFLLPDTFMVVAVIACGGTWFGRAFPERTRQLVAIAVVAGLGAAYFSPFYGKLLFQVYRPSPFLSASYVDSAAQWFRENRRLPEPCVVTSDPVTETTLAALLGTRTNVDKLFDVRWTREGPRVLVSRDPDSLIDYAANDIPPSSWKARSCGFLVLDQEAYARIRPSRLSWVGWRSGHWPADWADAQRRADPGLFEAAAGLPSKGWRRTSVPPFYSYYEPPGD